MGIVGKISAFIGDNLLLDANIRKEIYIFDNMNRGVDRQRVCEALKMVNLSEEYLMKKSNDLSNSEYNKLCFARDLANKEKVLYLDYFEKGMCYKEREYFKKLIKKLSKNYGISFIIRTNDFSFCYDLVDEYHIFVDNKHTKTVYKKDIYKEEVYKYFNKHQLIDFVIKSREYGYLLDDYYDINEVLKAIYRELE